MSMKKLQEIWHVLHMSFYRWKVCAHNYQEMHLNAQACHLLNSCMVFWYSIQQLTLFPFVLKIIKRVFFCSFVGMIIHHTALQDIDIAQLS